MQMFKAKDLYIVRPLKLVKAKRYQKMKFPYNLLMKLGLIPKDQFSTFCEKNPLKREIARLLPKHFYDSIISCSKSTYYFSKDDTAIATLDLIREQFCNVLTGERYDYKLRHNLNCSEPTELVVRRKIFADTKLPSHLYIEGLHQYWKDKENNIDAIEPQRDDFYEKELTTDELREIRQDLVSTEYDRLFTVTSENSKRFAEAPFYNSSVSFDSKGNKIRPINKFKVKVKKIRR